MDLKYFILTITLTLSPPGVKDEELISGPPMFAVKKGEKELHAVTVFPPLPAGEVRRRGANLTSALT